MSKSKKTTKKEDVVVEAKETKVDVAEKEEPKQVKEIEPKKVVIELYRDGEGRLVLAQEGKPKRIAGSDEAFPEVARQFGADFVKERLV